MTAIELRDHLNKTYGLGKWPEKHVVDAETYANCCQAIFNTLVRGNVDIYDHVSGIQRCNIARILLGPHNGLMFKNVELIYGERLV